MPAFRHLEIFDTWPEGGGQVLSTVREIVEARTVRTVGGTRRYTFGVSLAAPNLADLLPTRPFRLVFEDGTFHSGVLTDDAAAVDATSVASFTGAGFAAALSSCPPCTSTDGDGVPAMRFDSGPLTFAQHWTNFISPAIVEGGFSFVALGTNGTSGTQLLTYDSTDPWSAINALASAFGCEVDLRLSAGQWLVDAVAQVGSGSTGGELRVTRNATITRSRTRTGRVTRGYFKGANGTTMAEAVWKVSAKATNVITLQDPAGGVGPILADGQLVGCYLEAADRSTRSLISASSTSAQTVTVASGTAFTVGDLVRVRKDSAGTRLIYLEHPTYVQAPPTGAGILTGYVERDDLPGVTNLVPNSIMAIWTGSSSTAPDGWAAVGSPTLAKTTTIGLFETAGESCRVQTTADGAGLATALFTISPTALNPTASGFVRYRLASGAVRIELVATDGTSTWIIPDGVQAFATDTTLGTFVSVGVAGINLKQLGATSARLRIVQHGPGTADFYVDAAQYSETAGQQPFVDGAGATKGWQAVNEFLSLNAPTQVRYDGQAIDFYRLDPVNYSALPLVLGAQHSVVDEILGYVDGVRVLELDENALEEGDTKVTLSSRPEDIASLFAQDAAKRLSNATVNTPPLGGARTITDATVTIFTATLTSATAGFTASDVGKDIWILSGDATNKTIKTKITGFTNRTTVTIGTTQSISRVALTAVYGNAADVATLASAVGGNRAGSALIDQNGKLSEAVGDVGGRSIVTFFAKLLSVDPDTLDGVSNGFTYLKQIPLLIIVGTNTGSNASTITVAIVSLDPTGGAAPTITYDHGSAVTNNGGGSYTIAKPASGGDLVVTFTASKTGREDATWSVTVPQQVADQSGPTLQINMTPGTSTASITWSGDSVQLSIDGGTAGSPPTSPISVAMNSVGGNAKVYAFTASKNGVSTTNTVVVPPQQPSPPPVGLLTYFKATATASGYIDVRWGCGYVPSGCYFKLFYKTPDPNDLAGQAWNEYSADPISGATRNIAFLVTDITAHGGTECNFSAPNAAPHALDMRLEMYDGSNVIQAELETSVPFWAQPSFSW